MMRSRVYYNFGKPPKWWYVAIITIILSWLFTSCKVTEYVPVVKTEIEYRDRVEKDTVVCRDSIYIHQVGDTVYSEKYKYIYKEHLKIDTAYIYHCDTITKIQTVEKQLTKWESIKMSAGGYCLFALILLLIAVIIYVAWKIFRK